MEPSQQVSPQQTYLPAVIPIVGTFKHSLRKIMLATLEVPDQVCGVAVRVGYTGTRETDLAIYRLRVRQSPQRQAVTLPSFFVLKDGVFLVYQNALEVTDSSGEPHFGSA
jgi:hypothetical protein